MSKDKAADDISSCDILGSFVPNNVISWNEEDIIKYVSTIPQSGAQKSNSPKTVTYFPIISLFKDLSLLSYITSYIADRSSVLI